MEILAYHKKKKNWLLQLNDFGEIQTGMQRHYLGNKVHETEVPIFRAELRFTDWYQGTKSVMFVFEGTEEDSIIGILRGTGCCRYEMDLADGMDVMKHLTRKDDPFFEYHDDGWFTGVFTFKKKGNRVFITPFRDDISKERPVDT